METCTHTHTHTNTHTHTHHDDEVAALEPLLSGRAIGIDGADPRRPLPCEDKAKGVVHPLNREGPLCGCRRLFALHKPAPDLLPCRGLVRDESVEVLLVAKLVLINHVVDEPVLEKGLSQDLALFARADVVLRGRCVF
jgi:hypothetical protein